MKAIPPIGTFAKNSPSASSPPADAPIPATSSRGSADSSSLLIVLLSSTMYTRLHDEGCTEGGIGERALWCLAKLYRARDLCRCSAPPNAASSLHGLATAHARRRDAST